MGLCENRGFLKSYLETLSFFSSSSFHISPTSFAPNLIVFRSGPLKGWIVLASQFRVVSTLAFWFKHQCNTLACADAGPICQIKPINHVFILCRWVGKMTFVKLEWRLLGFAWISFLLCLLLLGTLSRKKCFLGRENHFFLIGEWRLLGFLLLRCLLLFGRLPRKKWFLGRENNFS